MTAEKAGDHKAFPFNNVILSLKFFKKYIKIKLRAVRFETEAKPDDRA